ncbi:MAG TPA: sigma-70 family RNA polymerase sigma factor [Pirellulales bacterium]|jgi:RNA polymerase sigma-70 factor (ECF subfamily)
MNATTLAPEPVNSPPAEVEDRELTERFARGDRQAFEQLVDRYQKRVAGLAARLLGWTDGAEDVTQEVFLAAYRHQKRFRGQASLWTYLATITVNRCRTTMRRRWLRERVFGQVVSQPSRSAGEVAGDIKLACDETAQQVRAVVAKLPASSREVIVLHYLEELLVAEVADVLQIKRNAVEVRLTRARKLLATSLSHLAYE